MRSVREQVVRLLHGPCVLKEYAKNGDCLPDCFRAAIESVKSVRDRVLKKFGKGKPKVTVKLVRVMVAGYARAHVEIDLALFSLKIALEYLMADVAVQQTQDAKRELLGGADPAYFQSVANVHELQEMHKQYWRL